MGVSEERRLGVVMFTDIVGYTSLSQVSEDETMKLLEEHRAILRPSFSSHGGREVKTMGDAFLVEFASSLEAVRCALEIQALIKERNAKKDNARNLLVRIGIHVGEIIHAAGDIYGDAVNIAARIEPLAEPGGICMSRQVFDLIQGKAVEAQLTRVGTFELKNVLTPMEIYEVQPSREQTGDRLSVDSMKKRVAVLPFDNFSPDSGDEYFADGLTEELIGTLSRIRELNVISRTSVMQYKRKPKQISQIGRDLNAGTILEGSVRKAGSRVRVSIQMIDAVDDKHVWAENYDRDLQDIFAVQSDIAGKVADALKVELLSEERKSLEEPLTNNPEANLFFLRGIYERDLGSPSQVMRSIGYFEKAVQLDPKFAAAYVAMSMFYVGVAGEGMPGSEAFPKAKDSLEKATYISPGLATVQAAKGWLAFQYEWDWAEAERCFTKAISINPSLADAHDEFGRMLSAIGRPEEAIREMSRAHELDPLSPWVSIRFGLVYWIAGKDNQARETFERILLTNPSFVRAHLGLAYVNAMEGRKEDAVREATAAVGIAEEAYFVAHQAIIYATVGLREEAREILAGLVQGRRGYVAPGMISNIYYALGDREDGYLWAKRSIEERDPTIPFSNNWPAYRPAREDPRYMDLLRGVGLS